MSTLADFLNRFTGRIICWRMGSHTADWTYAHMTGTRPICRFCKRLIP